MYGGRSWKAKAVSRDRRRVHSRRGVFCDQVLSVWDRSYRIRGLCTFRGSGQALQEPVIRAAYLISLTRLFILLFTSHILYFSAMRIVVNRVIHRMAFCVTRYFVAEIFTRFPYLYVFYRNKIISKCYDDRLTNFCTLNDNGFLFLYTRCGYIRHHVVTLFQSPSPDVIA